MKGYTREKATSMLVLGYRMEVRFDRKARRMRCRIIDSAGNTMGTVRRPVMEAMLDDRKMPLALLHSEPGLGVYSLDYAHDIYKEGA